MNVHWGGLRDEPKEHLHRPKGSKSLALSPSILENNPDQQPNSPQSNSQATQQDGRGKMMANLV